MRDLDADARGDQNISIVGFGVGAAGLATGLVLLLTGSDSGDAASPAAMVAPGWFGLGGTF